MAYLTEEDIMRLSEEVEREKKFRIAVNENISKIARTLSGSIKALAAGSIKKIKGEGKLRKAIGKQLQNVNEYTSLGKRMRNID